MKNEKCKIKNLSLTVSLFIAVAILVFPWTVEAAVYMLGGPQTAVTVGQEFEVKIGIDAEEERINVMEVALEVPSAFKFVGFNRESSAVNIWVQEPEFDQTARTVTFVGGVPGGATGRVVLLGMRFLPLRPGTFSLRPAANSKAYLNDGLGTEAQVSMQEIALEVEGASGFLGRKLLLRIISALGIIGIVIVAVKIWRRKNI